MKSLRSVLFVFMLAVGIIALPVYSYAAILPPIIVPVVNPPTVAPAVAAGAAAAGTDAGAAALAPAPLPVVAVVGDAA